MPWAALYAEFDLPEEAPVPPPPDIRPDPDNQATWLAYAYQWGWEEGYLEFARHLIPTVRYLLAGVDQPVEQMEPEDVVYWLQLVTGDFHALMNRHLKLATAAQRRASWRATNRVPRPGEDLVDEPGGRGARRAGREWAWLAGEDPWAPSPWEAAG